VTIPKSVDDALVYPGWSLAMLDELSVLHNSRTWELVPIPFGKFVIGCKWIFLELSKWVGTREPTRLTTGSNRVGLKFFYKFQYGLIFYPAHLEPDSSGLNMWWAGLDHQPTDKKVTQVFFIKLGFTFESCQIVFFSQHINDLYFFILVCIWIVLKFI